MWIGVPAFLAALCTRLETAGIQQATIRKAIGVLVDEGLAYTVPGRGTFATPEDQRPPA